MKNQQKGFVILLLTIIVALAIGASIYYYSQNRTSNRIDLSTNTSSTTPTTRDTTQNQTVGWKTYQNTKYGYTFKYPADWIIKKDTVTSEGTAFELGQLNLTSTVKKIDFNVSVNLAKNYISQPKDATLISVDNVPAYSIEYVPANDYTEKGSYSVSEIHFLKGKYSYTISYVILNNSDYSENIKLSKSIFSTFKLVSISTQTSSNNIQTFFLSADAENGYNGTFSVTSFAPASGKAPLSVQFATTIQSAGDTSIDYGDGTSCSTADPDGSQHCNLYVHTYSKSGTYTAILYRHLPTTELARLTITIN